MGKELNLGFLKQVNLNLNLNQMNLNLRNHPKKERLLKPLLKPLLLHLNSPRNLFLERGNKLLSHLLLNLEKR